MAKAIEQLASGMIVGHFGLGLRGGVAGSVRQQVHDGDTITSRAVGNLGIRFLGVDAPEISFNLPGETAFTGIGHPRWETFLSDPFAAALPPFNPPLEVGLLNHLQARVGPGTARNHHDHASFAEDELEPQVENDLIALGQNEDTFEFFLAFAGEVMDRYGRLLAYINRNQPSDNQPGPRPLSYNERLLQEGVVSPYFIWPNVNPFRRQSSVIAAVPQPSTANMLALNEPTLQRARQWVQTNRQNEHGLFAAGDPLRLEAFEVRFLAGRRPPNRWVIDLSKNDDILVPPQRYFTIPNVEDRLFIPEEYVPLFVEKGWHRGA